MCDLGTKLVLKSSAMALELYIMCDGHIFQLIYIALHSGYTYCCQFPVILSAIVFCLFP